jgi:molybdate transport system regulatory protein
VRLLELVRETGSISAAGRAMDMSYRRAWMLVESLNSCFRQPVVTTRLGGRRGGGASVTAFGEEVIARYRQMETLAGRTLARDIAALEAALAPAATAVPDPLLDEG